MKFDDEYTQRGYERQFGPDCKVDWAFRHAAKISSRQLALLSHVVDKGGRMAVGRCGLDFGGHSAYWSVINSLVRNGFARLEGTALVLLTGVPVPVQARTLAKPYIKVKKALVTSFNDDCLQSLDTIIWLDPRGDGEFLILLPDEMSELFRNDKRISHAEKYLVAKAPTFVEVINCAQAIAREYLAITTGELKDVLLVKHSCKFDDPGVDRWSRDTGLSFSYVRMIMINGSDLYQRMPNGKLSHAEHLVDIFGSERQREWLAKDKNSVIIEYTPEREAALEAMRVRLAAMAREFARIISVEDFALLIDTGGHKLLAASGHHSVDPA